MPMRRRNLDRLYPMVRFASSAMTPNQSQKRIREPQTQMLVGPPPKLSCIRNQNDLPRSSRPQRKRINCRVLGQLGNSK